MKCGVWSASVKCGVWSAKSAVWSVRKVFAWGCLAPGLRAGHVLGQHLCNSFAQSTHARAWLAHGACKFYRWERSYRISLRQLPRRVARALPVWFYEGFNLVFVWFLLYMVFLWIYVDFYQVFIWFLKFYIWHYVRSNVVMLKWWTGVRKESRNKHTYVMMHFYRGIAGCCRFHLHPVRLR